jgi:hypothetical protein
MSSSFGEYRIANSLLQGIYTAIKRFLEKIYTLHDSKIFNQSQTTELTLQAAWYYNI